jgi:hypothetical protein
MEGGYVYKFNRGCFMYSPKLHCLPQELTAPSYTKDSYEYSYTDTTSNGLRVAVVEHFQRGAGTIPLCRLFRYTKNK